MIYYERTTGEVVTGDVESNGVLIPYGNLAHLSDAELQSYLLVRVVTDDPVENTVPPIISDRQFFQQLAVEGRITEDEAIDAVATGTIPAILQTFVDSLPADQQFGAKMLLKGATEFRRDHPMSAAVGVFMEMTSDEVDDFFRSASLL